MSDAYRLTFHPFLRFPFSQTTSSVDWFSTLRWSDTFSLSPASDRSPDRHPHLLHSSESPTAASSSYYYPLHRRFSWQLRLSELWRSRNWSPTKAAGKELTAGRWSWVMTRSGSWSGRVPGSCFIRLFCTTFSGIRSKPILGGGTKLIRFFTSLLFAVLFSFVPPWVLDINGDKDDVLCDVRLELVRNGVEACYTLKNFGIFSVCCFRYCYLPVEKSDF